MSGLAIADEFPVQGANRGGSFQAAGTQQLGMSACQLARPGAVTAPIVDEPKQPGFRHNLEILRYAGSQNAGNAVTVIQNAVDIPMPEIGNVVAIRCRRCQGHGKQARKGGE